MSRQKKKAKTGKASKVTVINLKDIKARKNPRAGQSALAAGQEGFQSGFKLK